MLLKNWTLSIITTVKGSASLSGQQVLAENYATYLAFFEGVLGLSDDFPSVMISITLVLPLELSDENLEVAE